MIITKILSDFENNDKLGLICNQNFIFLEFKMLLILKLKIVLKLIKLLTFNFLILILEQIIL